MPKLKEPSKRARDYIKNRVAGMEKGEAAIKAGYAESTARCPGNDIESQIVVKTSLAEALEKAGMTNNRIAMIIYEAGGANRIYGTNDNFVEIEDHLIRLRSAELAAKIKGELIDRKDFSSKGEKIGGVIFLPEKDLDAKRLDTTQGTAN